MSVLLLSGGLDSAVCIPLCKPDAGLFVDYGQPAAKWECNAAALVAQQYRLPLHCHQLVSGFAADRQDSTMLVPGRNLVLIALAASISLPVIIGANADDYANYEDCRPEFFDSLPVEVRAPLVTLTKAQVGRVARALMVPVQKTWSCYFPDGTNPCGDCDACKGRALALTE